MSNTKNGKSNGSNGLKGGLQGNGTNGEVFKAVMEKIHEAPKPSFADMLKKKVFSSANEVAVSRVEIAVHAQERAEQVYNWIKKEADPFFFSLDEQVSIVGKKVLGDQCPQGGQTNESLRDDLMSVVEMALEYGPEGDDMAQEEKERLPANIYEGLVPIFKEELRRVCDMARLARVEDEILYSVSKDELLSVLDNAKHSRPNSHGTKMVDIFVASSSGPVRAFGKFYKLQDGIFGAYQELASANLTEAVRTRSRELAEAHKEEIDRQKQEVSESEGDVTPEQLLFGDVPNGITTWMKWEHHGAFNAIQVRRHDENLFVIDAVGKPKEALEDASGRPCIQRSAILSPDGEHLCLGEISEGMPRYKFSGFIKREVFPLARWLRTAAGACCPNRFLPEDETGTKPNGGAGVKNGNGGGKKKRPSKPAGEFLTDREFLYYHGLGQWVLKVEPGFHYQSQDQEDKPTGPLFEIANSSQVIVTREETEKGDKIAVGEPSTEELRVLLSAGGAEEGHSYFEGKNGASLPTSLRLAISQAFKRLKTSEADAS